jgi:hypothetical protein
LLIQIQPMMTEEGFLSLAYGDDHDQLDARDAVPEKKVASEVGVAQFGFSRRRLAASRGQDSLRVLDDAPQMRGRG